jgi:hypothetical protein
MVRILTAWSSQLQSSKTDVIKGFIVQNHTLICILHQLMDRQGSIVRLNNCIRYLGRWKNRECEHHPIWVFFSDLGYEKCAHSRPCSTPERMAYFKPCIQRKTPRPLNQRNQYTTTTKTWTIYIKKR